MDDVHHLLPEALNRAEHLMSAKPSFLTIRSLPTSSSAYFTVYFLTLLTYPPGISACSSLPVHLLPTLCPGSSIGDRGCLIPTITPTSSVSPSGYKSKPDTFDQSIRNSTITPTSSASVSTSSYESNPDAFGHSVQAVVRSQRQQEQHPLFQADRPSTTHTPFSRILRFYQLVRLCDRRTFHPNPLSLLKRQKEQHSLSPG